jgi:hypothetical protein
MRDKAAKRWRERKVMYKIGSYFQGCANCGETTKVEVGNSGRMVLRYLSGYQVYRAYQPKASGFTYYCYECSAKDLKCWPNALDIGMDAVVGARGSIKEIKMTLRKEAVKMETRAPSRASEIARLEAELAELMNRLKVRS